MSVSVGVKRLRVVSPCEPPASFTEVEDIIKWYCDVSQAINWANDIVVGMCCYQEKERCEEVIVGCVY